jgi:hypothetical protein
MFLLSVAIFVGDLDVVLWVFAKTSHVLFGNEDGVVSRQSVPGSVKFWAGRLLPDFPRASGVYM